MIFLSTYFLYICKILKWKKEEKFGLDMNYVENIELSSSDTKI